MSMYTPTPEAPSDEIDDVPAAWGGAWAMTGLSLAICLVLGSTVIDLNQGHAALTALVQNQATAIAQSKKAEEQLNALARGAQQLADGGNANAQAVVAVLQRNGVHINTK